MALVGLAICFDREMAFCQLATEMALAGLAICFDRDSLGHPLAVEMIIASLAIALTWHWPLIGNGNGSDRFGHLL